MLIDQAVPDPSSGMTLINSSKKVLTQQFRGVFIVLLCFVAAVVCSGRERQRMGAAVQEDFDRLVFGMPELAEWEPRSSPEDIASLAGPADIIVAGAPQTGWYVGIRSTPTRRGSWPWRSRGVHRSAAPTERLGMVRGDPGVGRCDCCVEPV